MKQNSRQLMILITIVGGITLIAAACGDSTTNVGAPTDGVATDAPAPTSPTTTTATTDPNAVPTSAPIDPISPTTAPAPGVTTSARFGGPLGAGPYPIADISVEVHADGTDSPVISSYRLSCLGDTATVMGDGPESDAQMCLAVGKPDVRSLLVTGPPADRMCTEIYGGPDVAVFTGTLDGEVVAFTASRVNGCAIGEWDNTLADLLPRPVPMT